MTPVPPLWLPDNGSKCKSVCAKVRKRFAETPEFSLDLHGTDAQCIQDSCITSHVDDPEGTFNEITRHKAPKTIKGPGSFFSPRAPPYASPAFSANSCCYRQLAMPRASNILIAMAAVTATASLSSLIGSAFILVCYAILPSDRHFRHILILNLAASGKLHRPLYS